MQKNHWKICDRLKEKARQVIELDFGDTLNKLKGEHLVLCTTNFDENADLNTTYLGIIDMTRSEKTKAEEKFPISEQGYTAGNLLDDKDCQILLGTGAGKAFMSNIHYLRCKSLHSLPKFVSKTQRIQVGNGQYVSVLFIIPIIIDVHGHRFEIFMSVSEIHESIDLVLGIKNVLN